MVVLGKSTTIALSTFDEFLVKRVNVDRKNNKSDLLKSVLNYSRTQCQVIKSHHFFILYGSSEELQSR